VRNGRTLKVRRWRTFKCDSNALPLSAGEILKIGLCGVLRNSVVSLTIPYFYTLSCCAIAQSPWFERFKDGAPLPHPENPHTNSPCFPHICQTSNKVSICSRLRHWKITKLTKRSVYHQRELKVWVRFNSISYARFIHSMKEVHPLSIYTNIIICP
jgi:hypothetical protein